MALNSGVGLISGVVFFWSGLISGVVLFWSDFIWRGGGGGVLFLRCSYSCYFWSGFNFRVVLFLMFLEWSYFWDGFIYV